MKNDLRTTVSDILFLLGVKNKTGFIRNVFAPLKENFHESVDESFPMFNKNRLYEVLNGKIVSNAQLEQMADKISNPELYTKMIENIAKYQSDNSKQLKELRDMLSRFKVEELIPDKLERLIERKFDNNENCEAVLLMILSAIYREHSSYLSFLYANDRGEASTSSMSINDSSYLKNSSSKMNIQETYSQSCSNHVNEGIQKPYIPLQTINMFEAALSGQTELGDIEEIDMAFHSGQDWTRVSEKITLLTKALDNGINIRILVNDSDTAQIMGEHMIQPLKNYVGFDLTAKEWGELSNKYNNIRVHIAKVPILHRVYVIKGKDNKGWVSIKNYMYGEYVRANDHRITINYDSKEYLYYIDEFDYIWNNASIDYNSIKIKKNFQKSSLVQAIDDSDYLSFIIEMLKNERCINIGIISVLAFYCVSGEVANLIRNRLYDDSDFTIRLILPNPKNIQALKNWYTNLDSALLAVFNVFQEWNREFPGRFQIHYTDLPITDRMYIDQSNEIMLVDHLSIPEDTNVCTSEIISKNDSSTAYNNNSVRFERIWKEYSYDPNEI